MPTYRIPTPPRNSSLKVILVRFALKAVKITAISTAMMWGHVLAYFLLPFVVFFYAFGSILRWVFPQALWTRITGRRISWLDNETKMSVDEMKERRLNKRD